MSVTMPSQDPEKYQRIEERRLASSGGRLSTGGGGGTTSIVIGLVMLVGGLLLSFSGIGRVFIGLIVCGVITLVRGIAAASK